MTPLDIRTATNDCNVFVFGTVHDSDRAVKYESYELYAVFRHGTMRLYANGEALCQQVHVWLYARAMMAIAEYMGE